MALLTIKNLSIEFPGRHVTELAVDDVSLDLSAGEILGLVGESGAGKSTIGNAIVQLLSQPGRVTKGEITLNGELISGLDRRQVQELRGSKVGFIFQDPMTSLLIPHIRDTDSANCQRHHHRGGIVAPRFRYASDRAQPQVFDQYW